MMRKKFIYIYSFYLAIWDCVGSFYEGFHIKGDYMHHRDTEIKDLAQ